MKCALCGDETDLMAVISESNKWLFKRTEVPMCTNCFIDMLDHKYYKVVDGESSYLMKNNEEK